MTKWLLHNSKKSFLHSLRLSFCSLLTLPASVWVEYSSQPHWLWGWACHYCERWNDSMSAPHTTFQRHFTFLLTFECLPSTLNTRPQNENTLGVDWNLPEAWKSTRLRPHKLCMTTSDSWTNTQEINVSGQTLKAGAVWFTGIAY